MITQETDQPKKLKKGIDEVIEKHGANLCFEKHFQTGFIDTVIALYEILNIGSIITEIVYPIKPTITDEQYGYHKAHIILSGFEWHGKICHEIEDAMCEVRKNYTRRY